MLGQGTSTRKPLESCWSQGLTDSLSEKVCFYDAGLISLKTNNGKFILPSDTFHKVFMMIEAELHNPLDQENLCEVWVDSGEPPLSCHYAFDNYFDATSMLNIWQFNKKEIYFLCICVLRLKFQHWPVQHIFQSYMTETLICSLFKNILT